uniref:Putative prohead protease n=1 Tax=viral metagenome TaxID=1070528 RepID=A0A6M3JN40_9ZZZZ
MPEPEDILETIGTVYKVEKLDIAEVEGNRRFIAGYANIAGIVDNQNEVVTLEALQKAWAQFKKNPEYAFCMLIHQNIPIAKILFEPVTDTKGNIHESGVDERGLYIVAQVRDDISLSSRLWKDIEDGKVRGYSIGGRDLNPQPTQCEGDRCFSKITDLELYEVSIVPSPANKVSLFNVLKGGVEMDDTLKKVADALKSFKSTQLRRTLVEISNTRNKDGEHELYVDPTIDRELYKTLLAAIPAESWESITVVEEKTDLEYLPLFDVSLSSPMGNLTEEDEAVGSNPSPVEYKPKKEGNDPLTEESEEIREETNLETSEESDESSKQGQPKSDAERAMAHFNISVEEWEKLSPDKRQEYIDKLPPRGERVKEESAQAPMTLETMAADIAILRDMVESMKADIYKENKPMDEQPQPECQECPPEAVAPAEAPAEAPVAAQPEAAPEPTAEPQAEPQAKPTPAPVEPQPTPQPTVESAEANPQPTETAPPAAPTEEMETRGVNVAPEATRGFDPMAIHRLSFDDIAEMTKPNRG